MTDEELENDAELQAMLDSWQNCTVADCGNKVCLGLSDTQCFPHYFRLRMNDEGGPIFPSEEVKQECYRILDAAPGREGD